MPLPASERERVDATIAAFVATWSGRGHLGLQRIPQGDGGPDDMEALDYLLYEGFAEFFATDYADYLRMASAVFGGACAACWGLSGAWPSCRRGRCSRYARRANHTNRTD